jgi:hypothetical protein
MTDTTESIATALAALTTAIATLASETARARGFSSALEARIAALEAIAVNQMNNAPAGPSTTDVLRARNLTTFERVARPVRDGQW